MESIYYNSIRVEILKRLRYLNEGKQVDFFRESAPFMLSMYLAYFGLAEDIMIERDSKDYNINTRFTKHVDKEYLKSLFPDDIPIEYIQKEPDGNSLEWVLSTLRNGIFHNGPEVNYKDQNIIVRNDGFLNNLECVVPFRWFKNFMDENIVTRLQLDKYTYHLFVPPFKPQNVKWLQTYDDINEYIDKELHGLVLNINFDKSSSDNTKIEREEFIKFSEEISGKFYNLYYRNEDDPINEEFNLLKDKIESQLVSEKSILSDSEYEKLVYFKMLKEFYEEAFKSKYPNYKLSITKFENKEYATSLFKRGRDRIQFFKKEHPKFQGREIAYRLRDKFNHDRVEYLSKIYQLYSMYEHCSKEITTEFKTDKFMERAVKTRVRSNADTLEREYAEAVKEELESQGVVLSYDRQITDHIIWGMHIYDDDIHLRCRELTDNYEGDIKSSEYKGYIREALMTEFSNYYDELTEKYSEQGRCSDQVYDVINNHNLYVLNNAAYIFINNRDDIIEALLYTLGINTYVMNKETHFRDFTDEDYSFMDTLSFSGYSHDLYKDDIAIIRQKRSELRTKQKRITKSLNGLQIGIGKAKDTVDLEKKKNDIIEQTNDLNIINKEISNFDTIIDNTEVIDIDNRKMQKASNSLCANIIRNCFAHCDRIHITGRDKTGETMITLTDYDNNGEISGIVETNLTSLITFLGHDIFKKEMDKTDTPSVEVYQKK